MINESQYDAILLISPENINEDSRTSNPRRIAGTYAGSQYYNADDPKLYAANSFGRMMQNELNNLGSGTSAEVTDLGKWVVVRVSCHHFITGRSASKTFLVVFTDGPDGLVMSTSNKWRTISGYAQAVSYIKSSVNALQSSISSKL